MSKPEYLSVGRIASRIGRHRHTVLKWLKKGLIQASYFTPGGYAIINLREVEKLFADETERREAFSKIKHRLLRKWQKHLKHQI